MVSVGWNVLDLMVTSDYVSYELKTFVLVGCLGVSVG